MSDFTMPLMLQLDVVSLTMSLVNIDSQNGAENELADSIEAALVPLDHLAVERIGDTVVARSRERGAGARVLVAGHLDTVPATTSGALAFVEMGRLVGAGASDAKGGLAVMLRSAVAPLPRDVTFVFHAGAEEPGSHGLATLARTRPELLEVDVAVLVEPTSGHVLTDRPDHAEVARLAALTTGPAAPPLSSASDPRLLPCSGYEVLSSRDVVTAVVGPGDPARAHGADESVPTAALTETEYVLRTWLQARA